MAPHSLSILSPIPSTSSPTTTSDSLRRWNPNSSYKRLARALSPPEASAFSREQSVDDSTPNFLRFRTISDGGGGDSELQTAVVSYRKKFPWSLFRPSLRVDLVSAVHIADKEYFTTLQKELEAYDCVLYEMVASRKSLENGRSTAKKRLKSSRRRGFNIIGFIQTQIARILMLDYQLDCLDYQTENWYQADLDLETFRSLQLERGESFFTLIGDMTLKSTKAVIQSTVPDEVDSWKSKLLLASRVVPMPLVGLLIIGGICNDVGGQVSEYPLLDALSRLDFGAAMKVFLAKCLTSELFSSMTADVEAKSIIIGERNKAATDVLKTAIDEGHNKIAVLYGGGHMADLGRRLREDFDLVPSRVHWITAWSIRKRDLQSKSFPFLKTLAEISGWPLNRYQTLALLIFSLVLALDLWLWELFFGTVVNLTSQVASEAVRFFSK